MKFTLRVAGLWLFWAVTSLLCCAGTAQGQAAPTAEEIERLVLGDWCLNTEEYDGEISVDGTRWTFEEDGSYTYRQAYESRGGFSVEGQELVLEDFGRMTVLLIDESRMRTRVYSTYEFTRDECLPIVASAMRLTKLNNAILRGDMAAVRQLVEGGVDVSQPDTQSGLRSTPLMVAIRDGRILFVRYLLDQKPDLEVVNAAGRTALEVAERQGDEEILALVTEAAGEG